MYHVMKKYLKKKISFLISKQALDLFQKIYENLYVKNKKFCTRDVIKNKKKIKYKLA